ncbi:MAG: polysaccharide pyruvyl transferase family protein [Fibrobacter sp.]|nr:polysaccharide pyruvyl transferase family protein [Fibrobacter sp.]
MKIGILTLPLHTNYGGILQAYALQTVLERLGHDVVIFNALEQYPNTKWKQLPKRIVKKILGRDVVVFKEIRQKKEAPVINEHVWKFRKNYLHEVLIDNFDDIITMNLDAIVVGSDQVWRPMYFKSMWNTKFENAFLAFSKEMRIKKIAYAASLGVDSWEMTDEETKAVSQCIPMFDAISVRETSGVELLKKHLYVDSDQVLDPTMLLDENDYISLFKKKNINKNEDSLLTYILDRSFEKEQILNFCVKKTGLRPFAVNNELVKKSAPVKKRILPSVESWLQGFYDAKMVVTDSFHACVFSIIFNKPFIVIGNKDRGLSRFESLLKTFGLEKNMVTDIAQLKLLDLEMMKKNIESNNDVLDSMKKKSLSFLKNELS